MRNQKKSDRPDWWGSRWNPKTGQFEDPDKYSGSSPIESDEYLANDEFAKHMGSQNYGPFRTQPSSDQKSGNGSSGRGKEKLRDTSQNPPSNLYGNEVSDILNTLLDKIDIQKKDTSELKSILKEERRRNKSLQTENNMLHNEVGKLRQVVRDLSQVHKGAPKLFPDSTLPAGTIPEMYLVRNAPKEVFDAVYKALTKIYHPDKKGGSEEKQKKINLIKEEVYKNRGWS